MTMNAVIDFQNVSSNILGKALRSNIFKFCFVLPTLSLIDYAATHRVSACTSCSSLFCKLYKIAENTLLVFSRNVWSFYIYCAYNSIVLAQKHSKTILA